MMTRRNAATRVRTLCLLVVAFGMSCPAFADEAKPLTTQFSTWSVPPVLKTMPLPPLPWLLIVNPRSITVSDAPAFIVTPSWPKKTDIPAVTPGGATMETGLVIVKAA